MPQSKEASRRIQILREDVARKIAAGEVIDRPFSVIRELLDNAIDAAATEITLYLESGGLNRMRLVDNGCGMTAEDLKLCYLPHATSKITEEQDLYSTTTLGFRGEALASMAACAKLELTSCLQGEKHAHKLIVRAGKMLSLEKCRGKPGTIVDVSDLFYNMPARRKFLKRPAGETAACKAVLLDKAVAHPALSCRFFTDDKLKLFLPPASPTERVAAAYRESGLQAGQLVEAEAVFDDFSILVAGGHPSLTRHDRKLIQIFVNHRRIYEYSLIQAVQYAYSEYMPGKDLPVAFVFISIRPDLVDFNIHPAKRECRFLNLPELHKALVGLIKSGLNKFSINLQAPGSQPLPVQKKLEPFSYLTVKQRHSSGDYRTGEPAGTRYQPADYRPLKPELKLPAESQATQVPAAEIHFLGQVFNMLLAAEYGENFFLVDQHAAHERLLYDQYRGRPPAMQELLFPVAFETEYNEQQLLEQNLIALEECGVRLTKSGDNLFEITALDTALEALPADELISFLKNRSPAGKDLTKELYSMAACRAAIKEGDPVDPLTALKLLQDVFKLGNARCPHGRPVWVVLSRDELFKMLGRK